jgi:hypothetical protein
VRFGHDDSPFKGRDRHLSLSALKLCAGHAELHPSIDAIDLELVLQF